MHKILILVGANVLNKLNNLCERVGLEHARGYRRPHPLGLAVAAARGWRDEGATRADRQKALHA